MTCSAGGAIVCCTTLLLVVVRPLIDLSVSTAAATEAPPHDAASVAAAVPRCTFSMIGHSTSSSFCALINIVCITSVCGWVGLRTRAAGQLVDPSSSEI